MTRPRIRPTAALGLVAVALAVGLFLTPTPALADEPAVKGAAAKPNNDVFGYTGAFDERLAKIGQISPAQFAKMFPSQAKYLDKLSWDPTTAKFWNEANIDPAKHAKPSVYDFRLDDAEKDAFKKNGFVVSERMSAPSFAEQFYRIYSHDLPVFVSSDALLHAWHRSFDAILEELEETYLYQSLDEILEGMAGQIPAASEAYGKGVLGDSLKDADYFLGVARSLLHDKSVKTQLNQDGRVETTLRLVVREAMLNTKLFGRDRVVDFSQFKVRGHYEKTALLRQYFKAMMWCGRTDLRVAGGKDENLTSSSPREMGGAIVLHDLLRRAKKFEQWQQFDRLIQTFVGRTDSMTFAQLDAVLAKGGIKDAARIEDLDAIKKVQDQILEGKIGLQHVRSDYVVSSPFGQDKAELPRSFTVLGQKFVVDSWVTAKVVADDVFWDERKVQRRVPSALDVAFAAFGNDQAVPELVARMNDTAGRKFRDGLNYQHNLAAVRQVIDSQDKAVWDENLYMNWLGTLRELSVPTTDEKFPEAMRTRAWAMKSLNTQLASWSQLRHDTILYVKQSYTGGALCYYPHGFVEPIPAFWARLEKMAARSADLLEKTEYPDRTLQKPIEFEGKVVRHMEVKLREVQKKQVEFLKNFAKQVGIIKGIAGKQQAQKELTAAESKFLEDVVQIRRGSGGTFYNGWYPGLFYASREDSGMSDAIVADVHTDVPAPVLGDPGCVLTQGVGNVDLLVIAIDNGKDRVVYLGPTLSHYEFEMPGVTRKSDSEWRNDLAAGKLPPRPTWTKGYLVPSKTPPAPVRER